MTCGSQSARAGPCPGPLLTTVLPRPVDDEVTRTGLSSQRLVSLLPASGQASWSASAQSAGQV